MKKLKQITIEACITGYEYRGAVIGKGWFGGTLYVPFTYESEDFEDLELEDYANFGFQVVEGLVYCIHTKIATNDGLTEIIYNYNPVKKGKIPKEFLEEING